MPAALRVGACVTIPLVVLLVVGRTDLALYTTFGAFTAVYGRRPDGRVDLPVQARHAAIMSVAVSSGAVVALSPQRTWLAVAVVALWAGGAAALSDRQGWRPPGPLFPVFAAGACSAAPLQDLSSVLLATASAAATAVVALLLGAATHLLPRRAPVGSGVEATAPLGRSPSTPIDRGHVTRCVVAVLVAGSLATAAAVGHAYWAMVAAVAPLAVPMLADQLARAVHRILGTLVGLAVAAALFSLQLDVVSTVVCIAALQVVTEMLIPRHYGAAMVAITPLALLLGRLARPEPAVALIVDRGLETVLGVGVAVVVLVQRRRPARAAEA